VTPPFVSSPLVDYVAASPGLAETLVSEHCDDGTGHCPRCALGAQTGYQSWPCTIAAVAARAVELRRVDARHGLVLISSERAVIRVSHSPRDGGRVITEWSDEIATAPGTRRDAAVLAARHGLRPQVDDVDGTRHWRSY
jgi:hypothetical protein